MANELLRRAWTYSWASNCPLGILSPDGVCVGMHAACRRAGSMTVSDTWLTVDGGNGDSCPGPWALLVSREGIYEKSNSGIINIHLKEWD